MVKRKLVSEWLKEQKQPVHNGVLEALTCEYAIGNREKNEPFRAFKYMDEITEEGFRRPAYVGRIAWETFNEMIKKT